MGNIGDHEKDGNTSYDQGDTHNMDQRRKLGIMNMNYRNTPSYSMNIGISIGTTTMWNEMVGKKLNSSRDACLKEGVKCHDLFTFYLFTYLIVTLDWSDHLSTPALGVPMLSLRHCAFSLRYHMFYSTLPHTDEPPGSVRSEFADFDC